MGLYSDDPLMDFAMFDMATAGSRGGCLGGGSGGGKGCGGCLVVLVVIGIVVWCFNKCSNDIVISEPDSYYNGKESGGSTVDTVSMLIPVPHETEDADSNATEAVPSHSYSSGYTHRNDDDYDENGYDREGYDRYGYDKYGYDRDGFDEDGYDEDGIDEDGYDESGRYVDDW